MDRAGPGLRPEKPGDVVLALVPEILDRVLIPLGFAPGQAGADGARGQVIFCRGLTDSADGGCVDLVVDLEARPDWRITDVRYWGFTADRWHLDFDRDAGLADQLSGLARTLPSQLGARTPYSR
jgi:hypothetical protein